MFLDLTTRIYGSLDNNALITIGFIRDILLSSTDFGRDWIPVEKVLMKKLYLENPKLAGKIEKFVLNLGANEDQSWLQFLVSQVKSGFFGMLAWMKNIFWFEINRIFLQACSFLNFTKIHLSATFCSKSGTKGCCKSSNTNFGLNSVCCYNTIQFDIGFWGENNQRVASFWTIAL